MKPQNFELCRIFANFAPVCAGLFFKPPHTGADSHISGIIIFFLQLDLFLPESQLLSLQNLIVLILHKTDDMQLCDIPYDTDSMIFIKFF